MSFPVHGAAIHTSEIIHVAPGAFHHFQEFADIPVPTFILFEMTEGLSAYITFFPVAQYVKSQMKYPSWSPDQKAELFYYFV